MAKLNGRPWALYQGDCVEVMRQLPDECVDLSVYSPPFAGLYNYSSDPRDLSNCSSYSQFMAHYGFVVSGLARLTRSGRLTCVHVKEVPDPDTTHGLKDFPGDVIRLHERNGWIFHDRKAIWKEPLKEAIRTRALGLRHSQIVKDAAMCRSALLDYLLVFRRRGTNAVPIEHAEGLRDYAGDWQNPPRPRPGAEVDLEELKRRYDGHTDQSTNKLSHWIWQRYASGIWDDIRIGRVLPYKAARDQEDEKHVHPLQLDTIERCVHLWSNPGETVFTPFMGVGSEVYAAVCCGRRGVGVELKSSYFRQAERNVAAALSEWGERQDQKVLFA